MTRTSRQETPRRPRTLAVIALALLVPAPTLAVYLALDTLPGPVGRALFLACKLWIVALPAAWHLLVDHGRPSWSPANRGGLGTGIGLGVASAAAIGLVYALLRGTIDPAPLAAVAERMALASPAAFVAGAAGWVVVNSLLEEYVWRWFVLTRLERLVPAPVAIVGSAAAFTLHHVVALRAYLPWGLVALAAAGVFLGGAGWAWCYRRFRSVWPGWIAHALADVAVFAVGWDLLFG